MIAVNMVIVAVWFREDVTPTELMVNSIVQSSEMISKCSCNSSFCYVVLSGPSRRKQEIESMQMY